MFRESELAVVFPFVKDFVEGADFFNFFFGEEACDFR